MKLRYDATCTRTTYELPTITWFQISLQNSSSAQKWLGLNFNYSALISFHHVVHSYTGCYSFNVKFKCDSWLAFKTNTNCIRLLTIETPWNSSNYYQPMDAQVLINQNPLLKSKIKNTKGRMICWDHNYDFSTVNSRGNTKLLVQVGYLFLSKI